jgi:hypothetical protein
MCNEINFNVIFFLCSFTMTWIYYYITRKHLFFCDFIISHRTDVIVLWF